MLIAQCFKSSDDNAEDGSDGTVQQVGTKAQQGSAEQDEHDGTSDKQEDGMGMTDKEAREAGTALLEGRCREHH